MKEIKMKYLILAWLLVCIAPYTLLAYEVGDNSITEQRDSVFLNELKNEEIIGKHKILFSDPPKKIPVPHSVDAPMLGNGFTGIAISGKPEKQVYYIARNDFWRLKSSYNQCFPAVLGKLEIDIPELKGAEYRVEQDLYEAKTYSSFSKTGFSVNFTTYISAVQDIMIVEISSEGNKKISGTVSLVLPGIDEMTDNPPFDVVFEDEREQKNNSKGVYWISRGFKKDVDIASKASCAFNILGTSSNTFSIEPSQKVSIAITFSSNFKSKDCVKEVLENVSGINESNIVDIEKEHEMWWKDYWSKSYIDINDDVIEKQYYLSNYSMACFSRDPDFPPSIFGTCITKERPYWNGDYHLNYNHIAPYYGLYSSNHIEQANPFNAPVLAMMERGKYYSKKITGIPDGIMLPVGIGPLGMESTRKNDLMVKHRYNYIDEGSVEDEGLFFGQKSNSAYCLINMASQFYYTYDLEYGQRIYPFVKGVASFWEHYLKLEDNRYVIYNDAIHEGTVGTMNPILSLGLVRKVMELAIDLSKELKVDMDKIEKWQHIFDNLSKYPIQNKNGKTVFRYTEKGTDWWDNNTLGIQHIYPSGQIGLYSDTELLRIAKNTIDVMQRWIDPNGSNSFFPAAVRVGYNADTILAKLHKYIDHTYPNGFQLDNPHGIENFSTVPNTINEMLCMGYGEIIRVFPVWPKKNDATFVKIRTKGAFLVSSELKNGIIQYVKVFSEKGKVCLLENPWPDVDVRILRGNGKEEILKGKTLNIEIKEGEDVVLTAL
ncbi:hypothetical protein [Reichenbachiella sp. MALMAid0571]|uniref:glycosyl hydrolase family 95 catalytic domain-containing protein n=1 Tax=Reichenbachiella sp. MALMAid0571 TaxID=3143939 RepID=UPI0032DEC951